MLMGVLVFGWLATGAMFLSQGAWPVFGFFGLDVLLVYVAFRLNYRAARAREEVSVSRTALDIRKIGAVRARPRQHRFNPFWSRFSVARHAEIGITRMQVEAQGKLVRDRRLSQSRRPRELCGGLFARAGKSEGLDAPSTERPRKTTASYLSEVCRNRVAAALGKRDIRRQWRYCHERPIATRTEAILAARHHARRRRLRDRPPGRSKRSASTIATSLHWRRSPRRSARRRPACRSCSPAGRVSARRASCRR